MPNSRARGAESVCSHISEDREKSETATYSKKKRTTDKNKRKKQFEKIELSSRGREVKRENERQKERCAC